MSVYVTSWVFDHSKTEYGQRLVLLALADYADGDTWTCWPSIPRIAQKTRLTERTVQRCLRALEASGRLVIHLNAGPVFRSDRRPNLYEITRTDETTLSDKTSTHEVTDHEDTPVVEPPQNRTRGDTENSYGVTPMSPQGPLSFMDPSKEPSIDLLVQKNLTSPALKAEVVGMFEEVSTPAQRLGRLLADLIAENGSNRPKTNSNWFKPIEYLLKNANINESELEKVIRWTQEDQKFWSGVILSSKALRVNFDKVRRQCQMATKSKLRPIDIMMMEAGLK